MQIFACGKRHFYSFMEFCDTPKKQGRNILEGCPIHPHCNDPLKAYQIVTRKETPFWNKSRGRLNCRTALSSYDLIQEFGS